MNCRSANAANVRSQTYATSISHVRKLRSYVVIPARYASTRLPRKMLLRETGKTLLQHTYEAACAAQRPAGVLVATDHAEIAGEVERFRGDFVMTSPDCASGTDRVAEVARKLPRADIIVNVQGDEPEMSPENIDRVIELLEQNPSAGMATLATPMRSPEQLANPACVKVVFDDHGRAMYFSRSPIPFVRDPDDTQPFNDRRCFTSISASMPIAAIRCSKSPRCRRRRSSKRRSSSSSACCNQAARSWWPSSSTPPAASIRRPTTRRSSPAAARRR